MRGYATEAEIGQYRRDGFTVLPDVLDPAEVAAWRATLSQAVARRPGRLPGPGTRYAEFFHSEHEYYDRVKEPYGNPTAFHVDVPFWAFTSPDALTIWIALDDATLQNGCLGYIPGSQREQRFDNADIGPELGALFAVYPQWKDVEPVFCPVPAGSAVAHNGLTAHGAGANMTPRPRFAMTVAYLPDGATFNGQQDVYTAEEAARLQVGQPLADPALNPLVYPVDAPL